MGHHDSKWHKDTEWPLWIWNCHSDNGGNYSNDENEGDDDNAEYHIGNDDDKDDIDNVIEMLLN